jgi:hypothetical protein
LQRGGGHYLASCKLRSGEARAEEALSHKGPFTTIDEHLFAKEIVVGDGAKRQRLVLVKNLKEQKPAQEKRQQLIQTLEEKIKPFNARKKKSSDNKTLKALKSHRLYGKYLIELKDGRLKIDRSKFEFESRYDGKYLLESSDDTLSLRGIVLGHKQLYDVEQAFRTLKTTVEAKFEKCDKIRRNDYPQMKLFH